MLSHLQSTCLLSFLIVLKLDAQTSDIQGVVRDSVTGEFLPSATIVVQPGNKGSPSNKNGFFLIAGLGPGSYTLRASYVGYHSKDIPVRVASGQSTELSIRLVPSELEIADVTVTGRRKNEYERLATSVQSVIREQILSTPAAGEPDLFRSLQDVPSILSTSDVSTQFYVRGGAGDQNLILLDGMRIYNPYHAFGILSVFSPQIVGDAEVYTGAFPAGFGGRLSSVIDISTRKGRTDRIGFETMASMLSAQAFVEGELPVLQDASWIANFRSSTFDRSLQSFLNQNTPLSFYDGFLKVTIPGRSSGTMSFQHFMSGDNLHASSMLDPSYSWNNAASGAYFAGLIADRAYAEATISHSTFEARVERTIDGLSDVSSTTVKEPAFRSLITIYGEDGGLYNLGLEMTFPRLEYRLRNNLGSQIRVFSEFAEAYGWVRFGQRVLGWDTDLGLQLDLGSMFQRDIRPEVVQPRFQASREILPFWRLKLSYGRFTQNMITVNNEDDVISLFDAWISIPRTLRPELSDHFVVGLDGILGQGFAVGIQGYYKHTGSLVTYNRDKIDASDPDYINGRARSYGTEMLANASIASIDMRASYSLAWTDISSGGYTYTPRYDRRHTVRVGAITKIVEALQMSVRLEIGSGLPFTQSIGAYDRISLGNIFREPSFDETGDPYLRLGAKNAARLPWYYRLDVAWNYEFSIFSLSSTVGLNLINLTDRRNVFYFDRISGHTVYSLGFLPTLVASVRY